MNTPSDLAALEARARKRVGMRMGFYVHALVYVLVNLGLFLVNEATGGYRWNVWPLLGWGIGLAVHGVVTFASLQGEGWRERMVERELDALKRRER